MNSIITAITSKFQRPLYKEVCESKELTKQFHENLRNRIDSMEKSLILEASIDGERSWFLTHRSHQEIKNELDQ